MIEKKELQKQLFNILLKIPQGKITTYKIISDKLKLSNPRIVGKILHTNENPKLFPCHRVIRSDGSIAQGYAFGGQKAQIKLLKKEGVPFKSKRVDISKALCILTEL